MITKPPVLEPLPTTLWLVHHPGNRPYLGTLYEDRDVALHAKRSFEVVVEIRLTDDSPPKRCAPDDHLYVAKAGSPIGEGICMKCGAVEQSENGEGSLP